MLQKLKGYNPQRDKELRSRVKLFGNLLGNVLRQHEPERVLATVEALRKGFIALQTREDPGKRARLMKLIAKLDPDSLEQVIRAFSTYFSLVNIAEEEFHHRKRRRRVAQGGHLWKGSFLDTLTGFAEQGVSAEQMQHLLDSLSYMPVFTAHPTEAKRRTIMEAQRRIFEISQRLNNPRIGKDEKRDVIKELEVQIEILWHTNEVRERRPEVIDEIRNGLYYFHRSLFTAVPQTYRYLEKAVVKAYGLSGSGLPRLRVPSFIRFGSWIGGDRDGNPFVKPETTATALRMQSRELLHEYVRRVEDLSRLLTHSSRWCKPSDALLSSLARDEAAGIDAYDKERDRFVQEIYRRKLYIIAYRLRRNIQAINARLHGNPLPDLTHAYRNEAELLEELRLIRDSLIGHGDRATADSTLKDLIRLVETFGFHLCELDVRQESTRHTEAVSELATHVDGTDYVALDEAKRIEWLSRCIAASAPPDLPMDQLSENTRETVEVFRVMTQMREEISERCFSAYVISMTHAASHVMEVMWLAWLAGLVGRRDSEWFAQLHVSPLFETIEDLGHIEQVLERLLAEPTYAQLLQASGNLQEVMLGYSDSVKDGGFVSAAWGLYEAQRRVIGLTDRWGVQCRLFHGRGGTIGRGGGPTHQAIVSQPSGTVHGQIKFTEQGEVLYSKYSNAETAVYELSVGATGLMKASLSTVTGERADHSHFYPIMNELSALGEHQYRELTDRTPRFFEYFYEATPANEIGLMNIGSRPSHRTRGDLSKSSIRAISWVFAWAQARHTLPAWYGMGHALEQWSQRSPDGLETLRCMYREWPFFRVMISNSQMALAKADMTTAEEYSELCADPELGTKIYGMVSEEYGRTAEHVKAVAEVDELLEDDPLLALSLMRRDPYIDPLNHLQIILLKRYRDEELSEESRERWRAPLLRTINAIAAGMRNTG
jgi:phosphoenolpyruvate carboxylase